MNLRNLSPKNRALVEALTESAGEEGFDVVDLDENEDGVVVTFSRDPASGGDEKDDEDEDEDR